MRFGWRGFFAVSAGLLLLCGSAFADITFTGTGLNAGTGNVEAAQAIFDLVGTTLTVTLTNTATTADIEKQFQPADILTAVFFGTNTINATPETATLTNGSKEVNANGSTYIGTQPLGGEWAYKGGISPGVSEPGGGPKLVNGISSTGLNIFGNGNFGCTGGACDHTAGMAWGIVPSKFPPSKGINGGVSGHPPYESDSVTFTLQVGQTFKLSSINNLVFQYGTSTDGDFSLKGVEEDVTPEPAYLFAMLPCMAFVIIRRIRRQRAQLSTAGVSAG
jgi:hypothetical protein